MSIFIRVNTVFESDDMEPGDLGSILVSRDIVECAVTAARYGWSGMVAGYHESEWGIARDLMLAGF